MTILNYENSKELLTSTGKFRIKLGLERISEIMKLLGNPQDKIKVIHIAGTNGKGSVCSITAEILKQSGYKTALYTSPHLLDYTERFKIDGKNIQKDEFAHYVSVVENLAKDNNIDLSEFEILTAVAYKYFYDNNVDIAVIETGLGGRFDATNIVEKPILTTITSISIDHKDRLGDTIEKIAFEKAGIIKNDVPVVINTDNLGISVIEQVANEKKCFLYKVSENVDITFENNLNYAVIDGKKYEFSLWGLHQKQNLSLVIKMIELLRNIGFKISDKNIENALKSVVLPARFQYLENKKYIIDGSHNVDAAINLRKNLDFYFPNQNFSWIFGCLSTKEYEIVVNTLFKSGDDVLLVGFDNKLSVAPDDIENKIIDKKNINIKKICKTANILNYFETNKRIIITGSFYLIGEIFSNNIP